MYPPVYDLVEASENVTELLGNPPRFYAFGDAPQGVVMPYAVWQVVAGSPMNYLGEVPDADSVLIQIDVYAAESRTCRNVAFAIRDAVEPAAYVTSWRGEMRESETREYRTSFDVSFITVR